MGLRDRNPQFSWLAPAAIILFFVIHCAVFMTKEASVPVPYAWGHLPLDDAWIHLAYAKNLLAHGYFTYSAGEIETGATSPLWALLLAAGLAVLRTPVLTAKLLGVALGAATLGLGFAELRRISGRVAAWTGVLMLALDPMWIMSCLSGMEVPLAACILLLLIRQVRLGRPARAGVAMGLLVLTRPEMGLPAAAAGVLLLAVLRQGRPWAGVARGALRGAGVALAIATPWFLYCRLGTGHWFPCSFYVKGAENVALGWEKFKVCYRILEHGFWPSPLVHDPICLALLALGIGFALASAIRGRLGPLAWLVLLTFHLAAWSLISPLNESSAHAGEYLGFFLTRYYVPDYALVFGLAGMGAGMVAGGMAWLGRQMRTGLAPRADRLTRLGLAAAVPLLLTVGNFFGWWTFLGTLWLLGEGYAQHWSECAGYNEGACRNICEIHEDSAKWLAAHVAPDQVIATQDAGAVRYFTSNPMIDLWGLNSHGYLFATDKAAYLRRRGVKVAVIFLNGRLDPLFDFKTRRQLARFESMPNRISEGDVMEIREVE